jgi:hypothetical protein
MAEELKHELEEIENEDSAKLLQWEDVNEDEQEHFESRV